MAKSDRRGNRKPRSKRISSRKPELGYYIIVTDTEETEKNYFMGLRNSLPNDIQDKLVIKVVDTNTNNLVKKCEELMRYDPQYRIPWIVFDRDKVINFDKIIKKAKEKGINVGWSNPCFEIWLYAYFGEMPNIQESWKCCNGFEKTYKNTTNSEYSKSDPYLYKILCSFGNENDAIKLAKQKYNQCIKERKNIPSLMCPATKVYELVDEIKSKIR